MKIISSLFLAALLGCVSVQSAFSQGYISYVPEWGGSASFGIFATGKIINTGATRITGDVGSYEPATGFDSNTIINGNFYVHGTSNYTSALQGLNYFSYLYHTYQYEGLTLDLSGKTLGTDVNDLVPGTYTFSGNAKISGILRLNDGGKKQAFYFFKVGADFNVDAAASVLMKSGGAAPNVFWLVEGLTTVGANAALAGNILSEYNPNNAYNLPGIIMNSGASISGKLTSSAAGLSLNNNSINKFIDSDGDGVSDTYDDYPTDPTRAYNNITHISTIAFEDNWPLKGDYDMNDLVMKYTYNLVTNAQNNVVQVISADTLLATGGTRANAFGIEFPILRSLVGPINSGTLEAGQTNAVFMLFRNMRNEQSSWNTLPGTTPSAPTSYKVDFRIDSANKVALTDFTVAKINPFIVNYEGTSRREVHLAGKQPTTLADKSVPGTYDDSSNKNGRSTYLTANGLPWAITMPTATFNYPIETKNISAAYLHFNDWAISAGKNYVTWYKIISSLYRNNSIIYTAPANIL